MRRIIIVACAVMLSLVLAAGAPAASSSELSINTRVAILENRVTTMQATLDDLHGVPSQLARIEEQIRGLGEKSTGTSGTIQEIGMMLLALGLGAASREVFGYRRGSSRRYDDDDVK